MTNREDLFEINQCFPRQEKEIYSAHLGHCSAFVKIANKKLYNTHAAWFTYSDMLRIYKVYDFPLHNKRVKA